MTSFLTIFEIHTQNWHSDLIKTLLVCSTGAYDLLSSLGTLAEIQAVRPQRFPYFHQQCICRTMFTYVKKTNLANLKQCSECSV